MSYDQRIYTQATKGTVRNPKGLPPTLASLLAAQAAHETGNFTSNFFRKYNNAFGYSYVPGSAYQSGKGTTADNGLEIAAYANVEDSTRELIDWIYRRVAEGVFPADLSTIQSPERYAELLREAGYYTDSLSNYTAGMKKFFFKVIEDLKQPGSLLILFAIGAGVWWYLRKR